MAAKTAQLVICKYDGNQLPIFYQLPIFLCSPGEGKKSVEEVLNCISRWYIYIHPISMSISTCLILKNKLQYLCKIHSIDV